MTNDELIQKFNPANAANLTQEDIALMRTLSDDQIGVLAKAYPNDPMGRPYLLLYDTTLGEKKQIYQPSTWQNLNNVRRYSNQKKFMPFTFRSLFIVPKKAPSLRVPSRPVPGQVVDLSARDAAALLRQTGNQTAATAVAKTGPQKPAAKINPPGAGKAQVVDVSKGGKTGKGKTASQKPAAAAGNQAPDEEMQSFDESPAE